jgi:HEAT repeat protein
MSKCRRTLPLSFICLLAACSGKPYEGKSVAQLQQMLQDSSPAVQAQGAFGLSRMGAEARDAVPALIACLQNETIVRQNAALALGAIGPDAKEAVPALTKLLQDPEWTVRRHAALALGEIGSTTQESVAALGKLKQDKNSLVRKAAEEALRRIRGAKS